MAKNKTVPQNSSVTEFIDRIDDETKRDDSYQLISIMRKLTGAKAVMWGSAIIGFGSQHYKYESGREGDMPLIAFSPRKNALVLYLLGLKQRTKLLGQLGKHKTTKGCVYIKRLSDVDMSVLKKVLADCLSNG